MSFLFPLGVAAAGALVPLVILYLLKQKRIEHSVPTNFLWERALEDLRASSLFQRLRTSLLLFLQALAIALFALAAAGASLELDLGDVPRHVIVLLDRSRSMKARDHDGKTRFAAAQELAHDAISGLRGGDEMMLIAFDGRAEVVQRFTSDGERLDEIIDALEPRDRPSLAADGLLLAMSYGQAAPGFATEVILISDGAIADELPDLPYPLTYARVGMESANQGITGVFLSRAPGEPTQLFARVDNGDVNVVRRRVLLERSGELIDARDVELEAGGNASIYFELPEAESDAAELYRVRLSGEDLLPEDDIADFVLRPTLARAGLLVAAEPTLYLDPEKVSGLHPGLALVPATLAEAEAEFAAGAAGIDLVIFDGIAPATIPPVAAQMYVNCLPPQSGLTSDRMQEYPYIVDWDRSHPTTLRCHFDDVHVIASMALQGAERSQVLVESTGGPLVLLTPVPGREVVVVAFPPAQSNLPAKLAWPLFLANTFDFLLSGVERTGEEAVRPTGQALSGEPGAPFVVETPDAVTHEVLPDPQGRATFTDTAHAGIYQLMAPGAETPEPHAYALLDPDEIRIGPVETIELGGNPVKSTPGGLARNVLLRDPLLLLALGVLVLEWAVWCGRR